MSPTSICIGEATLNITCRRDLEEPSANALLSLYRFKPAFCCCNPGAKLPLLIREYSFRKFTLVRLDPKAHHPDCALRIDYPLDPERDEDCFADSIFSPRPDCTDTGDHGIGASEHRMDFPELCEAIFARASIEASNYLVRPDWSTPTLREVMLRCADACRIFRSARGVDFHAAAANHGFELVIGWAENNPTVARENLAFNRADGVVRTLRMPLGENSISGRTMEYDRPIDAPFLIIGLMRNDQFFRLWGQAFRLEGEKFIAVDSGAESRYAHLLASRGNQLLKVNRQGMKRIERPFSAAIVAADICPDYLFRAPGDSVSGILEIFASGRADYILRRSVKIPELTKIAAAHGMKFTYADLLLRRSHRP